MKPKCQISAQLQFSLGCQIPDVLSATDSLRAELEIYLKDRIAHWTETWMRTYIREEVESTEGI